MLARAGRANGAVSRRVLASWTYCSLFRRFFMCLFGDSFKQLPKVTNDACVYAIPKETPEDLAMLSVAASCMFTLLTATHSGKLICTDAPTSYLGAVSELFDPCLHTQLWRLLNRRGWVGHLIGEAAECVFAKGHEKAAAELGEAFVALGCTTCFIGCRTGAPSCRVMGFCRSVLRKECRSY